MTNLNHSELSEKAKNQTRNDDVGVTDDTSRFAVGKKSENPPGLLTRVGQEGDTAPSVVEFNRVRNDAYGKYTGDTVEDLSQIRDALREVLFDEEHYATLAGPAGDEAWQEYRKVTLTTLCAWTAKWHPTAAMIRLDESDASENVFFSITLIDKLGDPIDTGDDLEFEPVTDEPNAPEIGELVASFDCDDFHSVAPYAIQAQTSRWTGWEALIDLSEAPRTLR
ncbi:hypothetical protein [Marisediminicola antarctica]|uniref:Uncharacterized protein n=1 Tax=Marisediminicola antarctica TaxID=674079 RepID=A0A7L5AGB7_9MICO|nr:hypothetical protein [Marisediminicola antarctica]QHO69560.1 hypothetical protein BHD05_07810 [Marisediminicola antarctica]